MAQAQSLFSRGSGPALAAVGLLALLAAILAPSSSGSTKTPVSIQGTQDMIEMSGNPASAAGETMVCAGVMRGAPIGEGAFKMVSLFHGPRGHATWTFYNGKGTMQGTTDTLAGPGPGGTLVGAGTFTIVGGTGAYKGATGSGSLQTVSPKHSMVTNFTLSGVELR